MIKRKNTFRREADKDGKSGGGGDLKPGETRDTKVETHKPGQPEKTEVEKKHEEGPKPEATKKE